MNSRQPLSHQWCGPYISHADNHIVIEIGSLLETDYSPNTHNSIQFPLLGLIAKLLEIPGQTEHCQGSLCYTSKVPAPVWVLERVRKPQRHKVHKEQIKNLCALCAFVVLSSSLQYP